MTAVCYIKQRWSYITQPLAEAELLTHCFNSILMSFLAQRGKKGGRHGHKPPTFLFHFKTFHKGSKNMPPKNQHISKLIRLWLPNVYSFRKMFISLPSIFCQRPRGWTLSWTEDLRPSNMVVWNNKKSDLGKTRRGIHKKTKYFLCTSMWTHVTSYPLVRVEVCRHLLLCSNMSFFS